MRRGVVVVETDVSTASPPTIRDGGFGDGTHTDLRLVKPAEVHPARPDARFALGELLGHGGMGEVRLAHDPRVGRDVAVKLMRGASHGGAVARFVREARVQGRLDHPAIVPVYDLDVDEHGAPYFAMKRLTGETLASVLAAQAAGDAAMLARWPRRQLLGRLIDICQAIEFAHGRGVIHRDLKPANIMLGDFGEVYVLDWGIARVLDEELSSIPANTPPELDSLEEIHTIAGAQVGTPGYMPPEQVEGIAVDGRADVYALGCILFEILTGRPAIARGPAVFRATLAAVEHRPSACYPELDIPPELDDLCAHATANDLAARLATPGELAAGIQRYLDGDRDLARRHDLANEYTEAARGALARHDRARAMRHAGRALALDPDNHAAQDLVGHLLLTPTNTPPPEVEHELATETVRAWHVQLRVAIVVYAMFLLATPVIAALGVRRYDWFGALVVGIAANLTAFTIAAYRKRPIGDWMYVGLGLHCATLALAGVVLGPLFVVPILIVGSIVAFLAQPILSRRGIVIAAHALALLVPFVLELAGIVPRTFSLDADGLRFHPWAIDMSARSLVAVLLTAIVMQVIATSVLILQMRSARDTAERMARMQLWHLRQLLPPRSTGS